MNLMSSLTTIKSSLLQMNLLSFELLTENSTKVQMLETLNKNDSLVILSSIDNNQNNGNRLNRPVYSFRTITNWKRSSSKVLDIVPRYGIYFCSLKWILKRQLYRQIKDGAIYNESIAPVLHCVCKEPNDFCQGRIGPIDKLIPYEHYRHPTVNGIWISVCGNETNVTDIDDDWNKSFQQMKTLNENFNRFIFFVAQNAACVGIHIWNTHKKDNKLRRKSQLKKSNNNHHHHERPLILSGGFYVLEGLFEAKFLNYDPIIGSKTMIKPNTFQTSINSPRMIILSEGTHMIRIKPYEGILMNLVTMNIGEQEIFKNNNINNNNLPNRNNDTKTKLVAIVSQNIDNNNNAKKLDTMISKTRKIEVWLDFHYKKLIMIDYNRIMLELFKISTINI
ncbi:hypothetical protein DERP_000789 [Dermatophagoides pteronyssinus]|uniref:Uncharacterized protein n=1 Tax=Dermatophagoides pteronyssinus TaxID=6956 RepID=A0ABQ8J155_DERPT|nr:hypothetical protein DERP_000789 [Dermatophagoides pteronyssinus]